MTGGNLAERLNHREKRGEDRAEPPLQATRRANADQLPHEEPEIESARVDQQSFQNVRVPAKMHATHAAGLIEMCEGTLQAFAAAPQQPQATRATNAPPITIHRGT